MPFVEGVLNRRSAGTAAAKIASLHRELALVGTPITGSEVSSKTYGESTEASVREFQKRFGLRETGEIDPASGGIMAIAALTVEVGDREILRQELGKAAKQVINSPEYAY